MKILICGAGIAGIALASLFEKQNIEYDLVDRCSKFEHLGFAIILWPHGSRILNKLGLKDIVEHRGTLIRSVDFRDIENESINEYKLDDLEDQYGCTYTIHREHLHKALEELIPSKSVRFNTTVESITQNEDSASVMFNDGSHKKYDLVIASDGVRSSIRKHVFDIEPSLYGFSNWVSWLKKTAAIPRKVVIQFGTRSYILYCPSSEHHNVAYFLVKNDNRISSNSETLETYFEDFKGIGHEIVTHLSNTPVPVFHDEVRKVRLDDWYKNRVVLTGDAEHAMTPITGMGTSLALEDAWVLFDELQSIGFNEKRISQALSLYSKRRHDRVKEVERFSDLIMSLATDNEVLSEMRNDILSTQLSQNLIMNAMERIIGYEI